MSRIRAFDWEKVGVGAAWLTLAMWVLGVIG